METLATPRRNGIYSAFATRTRAQLVPSAQSKLPDAIVSKVEDRDHAATLHSRMITFAGIYPRIDHAPR